MSKRLNNFDALRLGGALLVALGHTMDIAFGEDGLASLTHNQSFGGLGLNIFCIISGYLITKSRSQNTAGAFFQSRALRILPALFVAIPFMALILGPCVTTLSIQHYFTSGDTWKFLSSIFIFSLNPSLPGVFNNAGIISQLYSLTAEICFYIFVGTLGAWRHFSKLVCLLFIITWAIFLHTDYNSLPFTSVINIHIGDITAFFYPIRLSTLCFFYLLSGSAIALWDIDTNHWTRMALFTIPILVLALTATDRRVYDMIEMSMLPFAVLGIGMMSRYILRIPEKLGDISYGVYIYHFAVAELIFTLMPASQYKWSMIAAALALTIVIGWLSFQFIEKRALAHKSKISLTKKTAQRTKFCTQRNQDAYLKIKRTTDMDKSNHSISA